jgi:antagonist of KipI
VSLFVLRPGALTTVQDAGRTGFRHLGVGASGALDGFSARVANLLAGNDGEPALLEITLAGPLLRFDAPARIAITGAAIDARIGDTALPAWRPVEIPAGSELRLGACRDGARAYLAVHGGFALAPTMGSRATDVRGGFGGLQGRALRANDVLEFGRRVDAAQLRAARWWVDARPDVDLSQVAMARVLPGRDALDALDGLFSSAWRVAPDSDRQGLRLQGAALRAADPSERISAPVAPGTVQLPPDGQPIVLLGEAQTVGGYPCIGHVASADLPRLAQCRPGDALHFMPVGRDAALAALRAQAQRLQRMALAIAARQG